MQPPAVQDMDLLYQMAVMGVPVIVVQVVQVAHQLPHRAMVAQVVEVLEDQTAWAQAVAAVE
jgi:hypothetical protein